MFTLGFRFSLWKKKMCSKPLPSPPAYPASMLWSCSCLGFYSNFSCTDINVCMFVFLFCLLPLNCMFYVGPDTNVTWCYLIATEVRQSKAIIMLKLKLFMEAHRYFQNWFLPPTWEHIQETQNGLTVLTQLFPFINPYSPVAWKGGSLTKHYT